MSDKSKAKSKQNKPELKDIVGIPEVNNMLKSCQYCGKIVEKNHVCPKKPKYKKKNTSIDKFRSTAAWQTKRKQIKERDQYLCQICIRELYGTIQKFTCDGISVHHAETIEDAWDKRLDDDNLICLCEMHHKMADAGEIPLEVIQGIIAEQQSPGGCEV